MLAPAPWLQPLDNSGNIVIGGKIYTYLAGTVTPSAVYTNAALSVAHPNPVVLDGAGRATIYLASRSYKFIFKTAADVTIREQDNITPPPTLNEVTAGDVFHFEGDQSAVIQNTTFPVGAGVNDLHIGTSIMSANPATGLANPAGYALVAMIKATGGVTVDVELVDLAGPTVALATVSGVNGVGQRHQSAAFSFTSDNSEHTYGIKVKVSAGGGGQFGQVWGIRLVIPREIIVQMP